MLGNYSMAMGLAASQERLISIELVNQMSGCVIDGHIGQLVVAQPVTSIESSPFP
jgi:hypothetical protein